MDLREAIERGELELHYQPIIDLRRNVVTGFEALARWRHPVKGMVPPAVFIPVAEDSGLILPLGEWALTEACRRAAQWPDDLKIAVNLSPVQFSTPNLFDMIERILARDRLGAAPSRARDHRAHLHGGQREDAVDPASAEAARRPHRDGRFRHRLFVAELSAQLPVRQDQGRSHLRLGPRRAAPSTSSSCRRWSASRARSA